MSLDARTVPVASSGSKIPRLTDHSSLARTSRWMDSNSGSLAQRASDTTDRKVGFARSQRLHCLFTLHRLYQPQSEIQAARKKHTSRKQNFSVTKPSRSRLNNGGRSGSARTGSNHVHKSQKIWRNARTLGCLVKHAYTIYSC